MTICESLAHDFPALAEHFRERERIGMERYGAPLDPIDDARDWEREGAEELLDGMVYLRAACERLAEDKRASADARLRWLVLREAVRRLAVIVADVVPR